MPDDQYRDNTGRRNPNAFKPGVQPTSHKPFKNKDMQALCQKFGMEVAFPTLFELVMNDAIRPSERFKAAELVLAYGFGRPRVQVDVDVGARSDGLNAAIERLEARRRGEIGILPIVPAIDPLEAAAMVGLAVGIEAAIVGGEDEVDE